MRQYSVSSGEGGKETARTAGRKGVERDGAAFAVSVAVREAERDSERLNAGARRRRQQSRV